MTLRERILAQPPVFRAFKSIVQSEAVRADLAAAHLGVDDGANVLDLGCGYGDWARYFAPRARYVGIDHNAGYIEMAKKMNAGVAAEFLVADVADPVVGARGPYDLVLISGVLHHLADDHVERLFRQVAPVVRDSGRVVMFEPVFDPDQRLVARLVIAADRGRFVRDAAGYTNLLKRSFGQVSCTIVGHVLRIPYTYAVLDARHPVP